MSHTSSTLYRAPFAADVIVDDAFWTPYQRAVRSGTVPIFYARCKEAGIIDQVNPDIPDKPAKLIRPDGFSPQCFWDSDIGKLIEMAGYVLLQGRDPELEAKIDDIVDDLAAIQWEDGYLNTWFTFIRTGKRWTHLRDYHELYCAGHLLEGAISYFQATGKRKFLDTMERYITHIATVFGRGPGQKRGYPGHEELELALVKLYRVTGNTQYLDLARYFIDERGRQPYYFDIEARERNEDPAAYGFGSYEYSQAHKLVREQDKVVGHAVRAMYLYSGMADVGAEDADASLKEACDRLWNDLTTKRLYVTGGMGPSRHNEGFTKDYDFPNATAYAEICASVGFVFWAQRMLQFGCDAKYADMMELALYNNALVGLSRDGKTFFYDSPLESEGDHHRWEWHECPCCPPNIGRLVASLGSYVYGAGDNGVAVHLFVGGSARLVTGKGAVTLRQETLYPWDGAVKITVTPEETSDFTVSVRIPGWCRSARLALNDKEVVLGPLSKNGYVHLSRTWAAGDVIRLDLAMPVERLYPHPLIRADAGRVVLKRGPLVYCLEGTDHSVPLNTLVLGRGEALVPRFDTQLLGGMTVLEGEALAEAPEDWGSDLYRVAPAKRTKTSVRAIPFYAWDHRDPGEMLVWVRSE